MCQAVCSHTAAAKLTFPRSHLHMFSTTHKFEKLAGFGGRSTVLCNRQKHTIVSAMEPGGSVT